jgi:hypothetical protein
MLARISLLALLAFTMGASAEWAPPAVVPLQKICGTLVKTKTFYDGIQDVFTQTDIKGKALTSYFLFKIDGSKLPMAGVQENKPVNLCVIGVASQARGIDSPPPFYVIELLR